MILFTLTGWALARFAGAESGLVIGLLVGMGVAAFVPLPKPAPAE